MTTQMKKLLMMLAAVAVLLVATGITAPAQAGPPPQDKASISLDGKTCTVTATYTWKNYPDTFYEANFSLYRNGVQQKALNSYTPTGTITLTGQGVSGDSYYATGGIVYDDNTWTTSQTRTATLRCR